MRLEAVRGHLHFSEGGMKGARERTGTGEEERHRTFSFQYIQVLKNNHRPVLQDKAQSFFSVCELGMGKTFPLARRQHGARLCAKVRQV